MRSSNCSPALANADDRQLPSEDKIHELERLVNEVPRKRDRRDPERRRRRVKAIRFARTLSQVVNNIGVSLEG